MIRKALLTGTFLLACGSLALAQPMQGQGYQGNNNGTNGNPTGQMENQSGQMGNQQGMMQRNGREGWGNGWAMLHQRFGHERVEAIMGLATALASGTFYRFRRGPDEVDVHCPPRQSLQDCVNGATQLMRSLQQTGSPLATGGTH